MNFRGGEWRSLAATGTFKPNEGGILWAALLTSGTAASSVTLQDGPGGTGRGILTLKAPANDSRVLNCPGHRYEDTLYADLAGVGAEIAVFIEG